MKKPRTPYAVICVARCQDNQGHPVSHYLTDEEYDLQIKNADAEWICPVCRIPGAFWDDQNEEDYYDYVEND